MRRKVNLVELERLKNSGLCGSDIAKKLGVGKGTISKNFKQLGIAQAEDIVLYDANKINVTQIKVAEKLQKIATIIESELDKIHSELEAATAKDKGPLRDLQLKHSKEICRQISLVREVAESLYKYGEIEAFKRIVFEEMGKESPELRERVFKRIKERRSQSNLNMGEDNL